MFLRDNKKVWVKSMKQYERKNLPSHVQFFIFYPPDISTKIIPPDNTTEYHFKGLSFGIVLEHITQVR